MDKKDKKIKVVELFAGVGGFRLGLEGWKGKSSTSGYKRRLNSGYEVVWSNQWEPSTKRQHAQEVYEARFGEMSESEKSSIADVQSKDIPAHDVLVGGFPCQDYSVATTLKNSKGLKGKKGVLWWQIERIIAEHKSKTKYLILENVDRLLKSPAAQRGRDFAVMLKSLNNLGYAVEWRVVNAADYGFPQRRRRVFIVCYRKNTSCYKELKKTSLQDWIVKNGVIAKALPVDKKHFDDFDELSLDEYEDEHDVTLRFGNGRKVSQFHNSGAMIDGRIITMKTTPLFKGKETHLIDILQEDKEVDPSFKIDKADLDNWKYLKGPKKEKRKAANGHEYFFSEGGMVFPDDLNKPSRTIITGEGGKSPSRFKHVVKRQRGKERRLTPIELERLNMFPDEHTREGDISDAKRAFFMGNALVVGIVEKIGLALQTELIK